MRLAARSHVLEDARLRRAFAKSRRAHPRIDLPFDAFTARASGATKGLANGDLYLAIACDLGLPGAWERLQARFRKPVRAFLKRRGATKAEAEQLLDDVWGRLAAPPPRASARTRIGTYDGRGALASWLCTVAWRRLTDLWRERSGLAPLGDGDGAARAHDDPAVRLADEETERLLSEALEEAWSNLTTRELQALVLKYRHQLPQTEIAEALNVGTPRVSRLLKSATRRLRAALEARFELRVRDGAADSELFEVVGRMLSRTDAEFGQQGEDQE